MARVVFEAATRTYEGGEAPAVEGLDLDIADGEFVVLVGPSGSGKSTALRMLAGLEPVDGGRILIDGQDVAKVSPKDRDVAMVFQNYALFPHLDVAANIGFGLKLRKVPRAERDRRVRETASMLDLEPLLGRKPSQLSGGQRQRVAMGRAVVREPRVFLMDEPLSNLDAKLRTQTRTEIASLQRRLGVTTVYVTHDQTEAMTMGDRVAVLRDGRLQQVGTPRELYDRPVNVFVAGFIGAPAMNLRRGKVARSGIILGGSHHPLPHGTVEVLGRLGLDAVTVGIRPEAVAVALGGDGTPLVVDVVEELGADAFVYGRLPSDDAGDRPFTLRVPAADPPRRGDELRVELRGDVLLFDPDTGERIDLEPPAGPPPAG